MMRWLRVLLAICKEVARPFYEDQRRTIRELRALQDEYENDPYERAGRAEVERMFAGARERVKPLLQREAEGEHITADIMNFRVR